MINILLLFYGTNGAFLSLTINKLFNKKNIPTFLGHPICMTFTDQFRNFRVMLVIYLCGSQTFCLSLRPEKLYLSSHRVTPILFVLGGNEWKNEYH